MKPDKTIELPDKIDIQKHYNGGYSENKGIEELVDELVETINDLINYLTDPTGKKP